MMRIPYWTIKGTFTLKSPLHLGSGLDVEDQNFKQEDGTPIWVAQVAMDCHGKPYLPASSLKGALRALAVKCGWNDVDKFFGQDVTTDNNGKKASTPGNLEICNAYVTSDITLDYEPHVKIDPVTGTAEHQKLFHTQVVPIGTQFDVEIHLNGNAANEDIDKLLSLLDATTAANEFYLGAKCMDSRGEVEWVRGAVKYIDATVFSGWWNNVASLKTTHTEKLALLHDAEKLEFKAEKAFSTKSTADKQSLSFSFDLAFHSPFMVVDPRRKKLNPNGKNEKEVLRPRVDGDGKVLLPASSLRGALMGQARRILNTMEVPDKEALLTALFGSTSQRAALQLKDQTATYTPQVMHMTAIDRLTGGGKDGALFTAAPALNPVFENCEIKIDTVRLGERLGEHKDKVIGLMALLLRDLDEGDITFGWGAAKGLGRCTANALESFEKVIDTPEIFANYLSALRVSSNAIKNNAEHWIQANVTAPSATTNGAGIGDFHNPYSFIPFNVTANTSTWSEPATLKDKHHNHSKFHANTFSGRIVCQLTTKTPIFIGASRNDNDQPTSVDLFKLENDIALPATSLRGLFSSLHESISNSNLRVLSDAEYSVRKSPFEALSAIGRIIKNSANQLCIEPLTLPNIKQEGNHFSVREKWMKAFEGYDRALLKVHVNKEFNVLSPDFRIALGTDFTNAASCGYWYMALPKVTLSANGDLGVQNAADLYTKAKGQSNFLIGQKPPVLKILSKREFDILKAQRPLEANTYVRGVLRTMAFQPAPDKRDMPVEKIRHHELFIPCPEELDEYEPIAIPITKVCKNKFDRLEQDRLNTYSKSQPPPADWRLRKPYIPLQSPKASNKLDEPRGLRLGDLVFFEFELDETGSKSKVTEVAYSSIWRNLIAKTDGTPYFTRDLVKTSFENLPPLGASGRTLLSPTELMFGVIEDTKTDPPLDPKKIVTAFASKVSFGFGYKSQDGEISRSGDVTLKILASPKPPSPAMYLMRNDNAFPTKFDLAKNPSQFKLKGRKQYLHALRDDSGTVKNLTNTGEVGGQTPPWKTSDPQDNSNQKVTINPIDKGNSFVFEVDFKNLSKEELGTLCASLRPNNEFEHKLGMGKPLGLGSVKVDFLGLYLIDRQARYQDDEFKAATQTRYHHVWRNSNIQISEANWPGHLQIEAKLNTSTQNIDPHDLANQAMTKLQTRAPEVFQALCVLGDPKAVTKPVHYPQLRKDTVIRPARGHSPAVLSKGLLEENLYEWFVHNDNNMHQSLEAVKAFIPALKRH